MTYGIYSIYDEVAELGGPIFISRNNATAARSFREFMIRNKEIDGEFTLLRVGIWDDEKVKLTETAREKVPCLLTPSQPQKELKEKEKDLLAEMEEEDDFPEEIPKKTRKIA